MMGKGARNRKLRKLIATEFPTAKDQVSIARAFRRHGRAPLPKGSLQR